MKKLAVIVVYTLAFWIVLPALLVISSLTLDRHLHLRAGPSVIRIVLGSALAAVSSWALVVSIVQFVRFSRKLPISAMPPDRVIQSGIYALMRHPIYLFYTLLFVGGGMVIGSLSMLVIVLPVFVLVQLVYVVIEEAALVRRHGDVYRYYRGRTGLVIPRFYHWLKIPVYVIDKCVFSGRTLHRDRLPLNPPFFIVAAHRNYLDPFIIATAVSYPIHYVTTFDVFRGSVSRFLFRKLLCIPRKRFTSDPAATRRTLRLVSQGAVIGLFPEGERSWTGSMLPLKPEALKLLRKCAGVPVVPVRLEGNYHAWPRWGARIRRAPVTVTFGEPLHVDPGWSIEQVERALTERIAPRGAGVVCRSRNRVRDLRIVIYRCPVCRSSAGMAVLDGRRMRCTGCSSVFELTPSYELAYHVDGGRKAVRIDDVYRAIHITAADVAPLTDAGGAPAGRPPEIARCAGVACSVETGARLVVRLRGALTLTSASLACSSGPGGDAIAIPLPSVQSVTIESNNRLQVYDGASSRLYQFRFVTPHALMWQDYLVEALSRYCGSRPNVR